MLYGLFSVLHFVVSIASAELCGLTLRLESKLCDSSASVPLLLLWECVFGKVQPSFPNRWAGL